MIKSIFHTDIKSFNFVYKPTYNNHSETIFNNHVHNNKKTNNDERDETKNLRRYPRLIKTSFQMIIILNLLILKRLIFIKEKRFNIPLILLRP